MDREHQSRDGLPVLLLSVIGLIVSVYLSYIYVSGSRLLCEGFAGCDYVAASPYSRVADVPIALLGVVGYLAIGGLTLVRRRLPQHRGILILATFGLSLMGFLYSAYLTYVEFLVLDAICPWCIVSALTMTAILVISTREVLAT